MFKSGDLLGAFPHDETHLPENCRRSYLTKILLRPIQEGIKIHVCNHYYIMTNFKSISTTHIHTQRTYPPLDVGQGKDTHPVLLVINK